MVGFSNERARPHLRLVDDHNQPGQGPNVADEATGSQPLEQVGSSVAANVAVASALAREAALLRAVRGRASVAVGPHVPMPGRDVNIAPAAERPAVRSEGEASSSAELGSRFEALADHGVAGGRLDAGRLEAALNRLREELSAVQVDEVTDESVDVSVSEQPQIKSTLHEDGAAISLEQPTASPAPSLWVPGALRELAQVDQESAGRVVIAELSMLHRVDPSARVAVKVSGQGLVIADCHGQSTELTRLAGSHIRRDGRNFVRAKAPKLIHHVLRGRGGLRSSRIGIAQLRALACLPVGTGELIDAGVSIDPLAFWRLVACALPAVSAGEALCVEHRSPVSVGGFAAIQLVPGRPIVVSDTPLGAPDAVVGTDPRDVVRWAAGVDLVAPENFSQTGDAAAVDALRAQIAGLGLSRSLGRELNRAHG